MAYGRDGLVMHAQMQILQTPTIRLCEVARRCGVSPAALRRATRAESGACLRDWRQAQRQSSAQTMLMAIAPCSVKEVSVVLGFSSQQCFARWFRRHTGMSPSAFRSRHVRADPGGH